MGGRFYLILRRRMRRAGVRRRCSPALVTVLLGATLGASLIGMLELRLRPVVEELAVVQVNVAVTDHVNRALAALDTQYDMLALTQRDEQGNILAITTDMPAVNRLRGKVSDCVLDAVAAIDVHELGVPLGSLFDIDLAWAKGPAIRVHSLVAGTVQAQVRSEFTSAGINQTLHRIVMDVTVPLTVLLPGITVETEVFAGVCVAETVIVGRVPETYLALDAQRTAEG